MREKMREKTLTALSEWVLRVCENKDATPGELGALPEVAKIVLEHSTTCSRLD